MREHLYRYGEFASQDIDKFAGIDDNEGFSAASDQQLFFEHGSATSFYQVAVGVYLIRSVECPVGAFVPKGGLRDA